MTTTEQKRILKAISDTKKRLMASPEAAKKFLEETGIYNPDGSIADEYKAPKRA